jgi:hypothetical protein
MGVGVSSGVGVGGVYIAVWVWKNCAIAVPTLWVSRTLTSTVGFVGSGACAAQELSRIAANSKINSFRVVFIFTSAGDWTGIPLTGNDLCSS